MQPLNMKDVQAEIDRALQHYATKEDVKSAQIQTIAWIASIVIAVVSIGITILFNLLN